MLTGFETGDNSLELSSDQNLFFLLLFFFVNFCSFVNNLGVVRLHFYKHTPGFYNRGIDAAFPCCKI